MSSVELVQCNESEYRFLKNLVSNRKTTPPERYPSKYLEGNRVYPMDTPFPGPHKNSRTPYAVEILDNMGPYSPVRVQDVMKGVQLGLTAAAEGIIGYYMGEKPASIIYVSSTSDLLDIWSSKRLEPLIDSLGLRSKITSTDNNPKSRKSGDKTYSKQFFGGSLNLASAQSAASLRSDSKQIIVVDEMDGAPRDLRTGEGNFVDVVMGRASAYDGREKFYGISSPTEYQTSLIWERYKLGDQRQYMVPCPHCGKMQWLDHEQIDKGNHGLRGEYKAGILIDAYYVCEYCHDAIFNHHKAKMLNAGKWEPQAICDPSRRSYQLSSLYSPHGMFSWRSWYQKYDEALNKENGMRSFTNLYKGMPYREIGSRPKLANVIELRGSYDRGFIPHDVLFITMGLDVQRGSTDPKKKNPPRLEFEIVGHGMGYKTWSIDYVVVEGAVTDPDAGAWAKLNELAQTGGLHFKNKIGLEFSPVLIFMDANDNETTSAVTEFCQKWKTAGAIPIRGAGELKKRKSEKADTVDEMKNANMRRFRRIADGKDREVIMINTVYYKQTLYRRLKIQRVDGDQRPGFCDFPTSYNEAHFEGLTAEEQRIDGSFALASGKRNEPLDCRNYANCAADVYLDNYVSDLRAGAKNKGAKPHEVASINSKTVLELLKQRVK